MRRSFGKLFFAVLTAFAVQAAFAGDVTPPSGAVRNLTASDFMPHQNSAKEFNETWSYQFVFDNGTRAFVNYSTLYVPASGKKIGCDMSFWNFKGKSYAVGELQKLFASMSGVTGLIEIEVEVNERIKVSRPITDRKSVV